MALGLLWVELRKVTHALIESEGKSMNGLV